MVFGNEYECVIFVDCDIVGELKVIDEYSGLFCGEVVFDEFVGVVVF